MINDHGLSAFKINPHWFHKPLSPERGLRKAGGTARPRPELDAKAASANAMAVGVVYLVVSPAAVSRLGA